jgi:hypothetical protein
MLPVTNAFKAVHQTDRRHRRRRCWDDLFGELRRSGARTFEVTEQSNARFLDRMTTLLEDWAFQLGSCATSRSYWFRNNTGKGQAPLFGPTSVRRAVEKQERFPLSDYAGQPDGGGSTLRTQGRDAAPAEGTPLNPW